MKFQKNKLIEDYKIFKSSLEEGHPGLYWYRNKKSSDSIFAFTESIIKDMTQKDYFNMLFDNIDFIGWGHSAMLSPKLIISVIDSINLFLPFTVFILDNRIYVLESFDKSKLKNGNEIISINGIAAADILKHFFLVLLL